MANRILVTHDQLSTSCKKFKQTATEIDHLVKKLDSELNSLKSGWEGLASDSFTQHWESKGKKDFTTIKQLCEEFSRKLDTVAKQMAEQDKSLASQMKK